MTRLLTTASGRALAGIAAARSCTPAHPEGA